MGAPPNNSICNYFNSARDQFAKFCDSAKNYRNNATFFHKSSLVSLAGLRILMILNPDKFSHLKKLEGSLDSTNLFYPFAVLSIPSNIFCRAKATAIDQNELTRRLAEQMVRHAYRSIDQEAPEVIPQDSNLYLSSYPLASTVVERKLNQMNNFNESFRVNRFKESLRNQFAPVGGNFQYQIERNDGSSFLFHEINLDDLVVPLKPTSLIEKMIDIIWALTDIGSVLFYASAFKIVDTAKWAASMGSSFKDQSLLFWLGAGCTLGHAATAGHSGYQLLSNRNLTDNEHKRKKWDCWNASFEVINNGAFALNEIKWLPVSDLSLNIVMGVTKFIGVLKEMRQPGHTFNVTPLEVV